MIEAVEAAQEALEQVVELAKSERVIGGLYKAMTTPGFSEIDFNQETVEAVEKTLIDIGSRALTTAEKLERADDLLAAFTDVEVRDGRVIRKAIGKP